MNVILYSKDYLPNVGGVNDGWVAAERSEAPVCRHWGTAALCPSHPT